MSEKLLRYWCEPRLYVLPEDGSPFSGEVDGFHLYEDVQSSDKDHAPDRAVDYRIIAERSVTSRGEVSEASSDLFALADDLDRLWVYITGEPLFYLRRTFRQVDAPDHWETNAREVREELHREEPGPTLGGEMEFRDTSWKGFPFYPLEKAVAVRPS